MLELLINEKTTLTLKTTARKKLKTYDVFTREYWEYIEKRMIRAKKRRYWLDMHLSRRDKLIMGRYVRHPMGGIGVAAWTKKIEGIPIRKRRKTKEEQNGLIRPFKANVIELHQPTT